MIMVATNMLLSSSLSPCLVEPRPALTPILCYRHTPPTEHFKHHELYVFKGKITLSGSSFHLLQQTL